MAVATASPLIDWLVRLGGFFCELETVEKLLDSEQTEAGESWNPGDKASSWTGKRNLVSHKSLSGITQLKVFFFVVFVLFVCFFSYTGNIIKAAIFFLINLIGESYN